MTTVELTIGGWFAGAVIKNFVGKARSILEQRIELRTEVGEKLFNVEASLARIQALVDVAERRAISNHNFTIWLKMIKEIAFEAEDLMDDFETKRIQKSLENKVSGVLAYLMNNLFLVDDDMYKLKALLARLDKIAREAGGFIDYLKLNDSEEPMIGFIPKIQPLFHGREKEKDKLMNIVFPNVEETEHSAPPCLPRLQEETRGTAGVRVVCIIGEAGVGKTALAQVIYNHPNVKEAFHHRGWVFLSHKFDSNDFFKNIVRSFVTDQHPYDSEVGMEPFQASSNSSEHDLSRIIQNKRFFLILDNAKDNLQRQWKKLREKLTGGAAGSIVLVTTRSEVIAESEVITLGTMPTDILSTILKHHAFGNIRVRTACLESIGDEISGKLHGLPLLAQLYLQ
ncbi:hypothetical protein GUJ93_ZPchr0013g36497 [Zizania palustris]|uniref:Uncharacterized protein n=1 Tax=Zizania palustris TaxID=103762 RepID=A0A8J5X113_ZIZPA|nr:hypothetical protein GUJ93_ZPchr0013g36497 [Zizania palustris]